MIVAALCQGCCRAVAAPLKLFFETKEDVKLDAAATESEAAKPLAAALAAARNMANEKEKKTRDKCFFLSSTSTKKNLDLDLFI